MAVEHRLGGHGDVAFYAGEVVEVFPDVVTSPFLEIHPMVIGLDNQIIEISSPNLDFFFLDGTLVDGVMDEGQAMGLQGAGGAVGVFGNAVQRSEFHQRLVVPSRMLLVKQRVGKRFEASRPFFIINRCFNVIQSSEHAIDVAVNHGVGQSESDGCDGSGSVLPDALEFKEFLVVVGKGAAVAFHDLLCASMEVPRP